MKKNFSFLLISLLAFGAELAGAAEYKLGSIEIQARSGSACGAPAYIALKEYKYHGTQHLHGTGQPSDPKADAYYFASRLQKAGFFQGKELDVEKWVDDVYYDVLGTTKKQSRKDTPHLVHFRVLASTGRELSDPGQPPLQRDALSNPGGARGS